MFATQMVVDTVFQGAQLKSLVRFTRQDIFSLDNGRLQTRAQNGDPNASDAILALATENFEAAIRLTSIRSS